MRKKVFGENETMLIALTKLNSTSVKANEHVESNTDLVALRGVTGSLKVEREKVETQGKGLWTS